MTMMMMENKKYQEFSLDKLFIQNKRGRRLITSDRRAGKIPFVTAGAMNNGISSFINNPNHIKYRKSITLDMFANTFFQNWVFKCDDNITVLKLYTESKYTNLFHVALLNQLRNKYSYANQVRPHRLSRQKILLPVNSKGEPDYDFMEQYMREQEIKKAQDYVTYITKRVKELENTLPVEPLSSKNWHEFFIVDLFFIKSGIRLTKASMIKGIVPFIGATDSNNGITAFIANNNKSFDSNVLGVNYNGSVVENFYHPYQAIFSDDVKRLSLRNQKGNRFIYLFIKSVLLKQKSKFQYAYKFNGERMARQKIMLPINSESKPDYEYMEQYMKALEYKKLKAYLDRRK